MENIEDIDGRIESLQERIHNYKFSDDIAWDKKRIEEFLSDLTVAHTQKRKLLIQQQKLLDTRSFLRKIWDFCKESPSRAILIFMTWICVFTMIFFIGFCIYWFGFSAVIHKAGELILGIFGLALIIGFLGGWTDFINSIRGK